MTVWIVAGALAALAVAIGGAVTLRRVWRGLPRPTSFAEGQRALYGLLAALAGMFCGGVSLAMIALLMWGDWSRAEEHTIVVIFGCTLGGYVAAMSAVIIGLLAGGPVGRFKASVSKDGVDLEAGHDDGAN